jgi:hypothetical protein
MSLIAASAFFISRVGGPAVCFPPRSGNTILSSRRDQTSFEMSEGAEHMKDQLASG